MDAAGTVIQHEENISPRARYTEKVNNVVGSLNQVSTVVQALENAGGAKVPVVAERAMYWNPGGIKWGGGHATVGVGEE